MKSSSDQYFPVMLFIMLHELFPTFENVEEILRCDHSNVKATGQCFPIVPVVFQCSTR